MERVKVFEDEAITHLGHNDFFILVKEREWKGQENYLFGREGHLSVVLAMSACVAGPDPGQRRLVLYQPQDLSASIEVDHP